MGWRKRVRLSPPTTGFGTAPQKGSAMPPPSLEPLPPRRILVVNSDQGSAQELATQLSKAGHTVEIACDGQRALEAEPTFRPDIVIVNLGSLGIDTFSLARSLRAQANRDVVLVAEDGSEEDHARAKEAGCFDDHVSRFHGAPFLHVRGNKLADQSPEDWVRFQFSAFPKDDFALRMLAAAARRFDPAEMVPSIPEEFLRQIRGLVESPSNLANYLAGFRLQFSSDETQREITEGVARWLRFFNP
jgi:CheY-like chemotaxis protein